MPNQPQQQAVGLQQIATGSIGRSQLNIDFPGQAVIRRIIIGPGLSQTFTGVDSGTGDVTLMVTGTLLTVEQVYDLLFAAIGSSPGGGIDIVIDDPSDQVYFSLDMPYIRERIVDGWTEVTDVWTRTGNHTFTASGDVTATYRKGVKVRYKDGGAFEYGVIGSSSHAAGTTTINLIPNSDYAMAATTITDTWISSIENPEGFQQWFNFNANPQGFSAVPSSPIYKWTTKDRTIFIAYNEPNNGTSNATTFTATAPIVPIINVTSVAGTLVNNGALLTVAGRLTMIAGDATITFRTDMSVGAWTAGGTGKRAVAYWWYEF